MKEYGKAYSPAAISSFFQICIKDEYGRPIKDLSRVGARGGGFGIKLGITTEVEVYESKKTEIEVFINGKKEKRAYTTLNTVKSILDSLKEIYHVVIKHWIEVPIGAGFGTSGAGALTAALALTRALNIHLTINQIGMYAHKAEIECKTGLDTVAPLLVGGGCILVVEPGGPGVAVIDKIPIPNGLKIISGVFSSIPTKTILISKTSEKVINRAGEKTMKQILGDPCLETFLKACKNFALESGLSTKRVFKLINEVEKAGAIGAAQNMIGEAVHAVVEEEELDKVLNVFKRFIPEEKIIISDITLDSARIIV